MSTHTVISLPWSDLTSVTFKSNENVNFSTINDKLIKLLENDINLYDLKNGINNAAVVDYEDLSATKDATSENGTWTISPTDLVWYKNTPNYINILFPIIPYPSSKIKDIGWNAPSRIPAGVIEPSEMCKPGVTYASYDEILYNSYASHLTASNNGTNGNIVRYDAAFFASLNKHTYFTALYDSGYRWGEMIMTANALYNLSAITKNITMPYMKLTDIATPDNLNVSASVPNTFDFTTNTTINQYILNDNINSLMHTYTNGTWSRQLGSGMREIGGIIQLIPSETTYDVSSIKFDEQFDTCLNVTLNVYNGTDALDSTISSNLLVSSPVYITNVTNTGFEFKVKPDYVKNNGKFYTNGLKTLTEFNIIWKAKGIM